MNDILLNPETMDLMIENGDLVVGNSDTQHQALLLLIEKGELKQFPTAGVGSIKYLEAEDNAALFREIRNEFTADGMQVNAVTMGLNGLTIDAFYK